MPSSPVTVAPAAPPAEAASHFARRLSLETDCADVHDAMRSGPGADFVLLDVRGRAAYARAHVPGALNLPHREIDGARMASWPAETLFVVYCAGPHCNGADRAALRLAELGRPVKLMLGGMTGWADEGFGSAIGPEPGSPGNPSAKPSERRLISSGSSFEAAVGYSRAVVDRDWVFVSGTTGFDYRTMTIASDVVEQAEQALRNIGDALAQAGSSFADVVRVRYLLPDAADFEPCWPILRRHLGDVGPAATMIAAGLADPRMRIEIEVTARRTAMGSG